MSDSYLIEIIARLRDETGASLDNLKRKIDDLKTSAAASDLSSGVADLGDEAERAARAHDNLAKQQEAHRRATEQSRTAQIQQGKYLAEGAEQAAAQSEALGQINEEHETLRRQAPQTAAAMRNVGQAHGEGAKSAAEQAARSSDLGAAMREAADSTEALSVSQTKASQRGDELIQKMGRLDQAAKAHTATNRELEVGYQSVATGLRSVWKEMDLGSRSAERFGQAMERAESRAKNTDLARASSGFGQFAQKVAHGVDSIFPKIVSLSAELRGMRLVLGAGFLQPMLTGLTSLASGFFSVASGAGQAAATIGGVFISGLGQLMPVMSVAIAGLEGLKNVFAAVQAAMAQQQEQFLAPNQGLINQLGITNALVEAEQNLRNAYIGVKEAQEELLQSSLQITEARQALLHAEATGSQEGIRQAQLQLQSARLSHEQARNSLTQARLAVPEAQRQIQIEQLTAAEPTSRESQQQATLQYLESMMSPVEKTLFKQLTRLDLELKSPGSPLNKISSDFLQPFVYLSSRLQTLLGDPSFLKPIDKLASTMQKAGDSMMQTIFGKKGTGFFETMAKDATKSIPIITKALEGFIGWLRDVAKAAAPAFDRLSRDWEKFWNGLAAKDSSGAGQKRLTDFFNQGARWAEDFAHLARAIVDLFMALGHDAAPQGMKTVTSLAGTVQETTKWVQSHGPEVTNFFRQARQALGLIGGVLFQIGKMIVQVFNLSTLQAFSSLLTTLVIPAFKDFVTVVGHLVKWVTDLLTHLGPLRQIFEGGLAIAIALTAFGRLVGIITKVTDVIHGVHDAYLALRASDSILSGLGAAWDALTTRITKGKTAINQVKTAQEELATTTAATDTEMAADDQVLWEKIATEGVGSTATVTSTEEAAGGLGLAGLGRGALRVLPIFGAGYLGAQLTGLNNITPGTSTSGLLKAAGSGAIAGAVGGASAGSFIPGLGTLVGGGLGALVGGTSGVITDLLFGGGSGGSTKVDNQLKNLKNGLKNFGSALEIPSGKLKKFYDQTQHLLGEKDITKSQRSALTKLSAELDPVLVKVEKIKDTWASSFGGISSLTGNVMSQVSQTLAQNLNQISTNMGTKTQSGAAALQGSIVGAISTVMQNTSKMVRDTSSKMQQLHTILGHALQSLGINIAPNVLSHLDLPQIENIAKSNLTGHITTLAQALATAGVGKNAGAATGDWHDARPGGHLRRVGEAGYPEVTLTTDPKYSARSGDLLSRYLQHMASGGPITVPRITGVGGIPGIMAQGDVDLIAMLMNESLVGASTPRRGGRPQSSSLPFSKSGKLASYFVPEASGAYTPATFGAAVLRGLGIRATPQAVASMVRWEAQEGGNWNNSAHFNPLNTTEPEPGYSETGTQGNIGSYVSWTQGLKATIQTLAMPAYTAIRAALSSNAPLSTFESTVSASPWGTHFAIGGLLTRHLRDLAFRHIRRKILPFADGGRAPWGGEPVPIVAHEGERISNPGQWNHIAGLAGMTGRQLDRHMGYDSGRPRQFQGGGLVPYTATQGGNRAGSATGTLGNINSFLSNITTNLAQLDVGSVFGSLGTISSLASVINQAFKKIGRLGGPQTQARLKQIDTTLEDFADPNNVNSTLQALSTAFQRFQNNLSNWVVGLSYIGGVRPGRQVATPLRSGRVVGSGDDLRMAGPMLNAENMGTTGTTAFDLLNERALSEQSQYLTDQNKAVQTAIDRIKQSIQIVRRSRARGAISSDTAKKTLDKLDSNYTELIQQQETLSQSINSTVTQRFQAEQQYVQDLVNQTNDIYQTRQTQLQSQQAGLESLGAYGRLPSVDRALASVARNQIAALQQPLREAERQHNADAIAQIKQQIAQLSETITQSTSQMVQDRLSGIQQAFQTISAQQQSRQSSAQALGQFSRLIGPHGIDQQIIDTSNAQISQLQTLLKEAQATGNRAAAAQIKQQIAQLRETVTQTAAQQIQDTISGIQQTAQTQQAQVSMQQSIAQTMEHNATTPSQFAAAGALNLQALQTNQGSLQSQISQYNTLLGQAISQGNETAVASITQTIDQLSAQLVQNTQALTDNTAQVVSQTAAYIQNQGQFQTGTLSGLAQVITTIGHTTGFTNVQALKQLTSASNVSLQNTNSGLLQQLAALGGGASGLASILGGATTPQAFVAALSGANLGSITAGQDSTWIQTFDTLIQNLTSNTEAIATNNQQLATLNGQLLQPQQWSTSAFTAFRTAIFSGMGNLLPQYQNSLAGTGYQPTIAPIFGSVGGSGVVPAVGTLNINHVPASTVQPAILGEQLAHEMSGALA